MNLDIYKHTKGIWRSAETLPFTEASAIRIRVSDGESGEPLCGTLTVNGTPFEVSDGIVTARLSAFSRNKSSEAVFWSADGVRFPCSNVEARGEAWYFPPPSECFTDGEITALLRLTERLERLARRNASAERGAVSQVLGI